MKVRLEAEEPTNSSVPQSEVPDVVIRAADVRGVIPVRSGDSTVYLLVNLTMVSLKTEGIQ